MSGKILNKKGGLLDLGKLKKNELQEEAEKSSKKVKGLITIIDEYVRENGVNFTELALALDTFKQYFRQAADKSFKLPEEEKKK